MSDVIAAVDLGSNSFHMVVARYSHGQLVIIDRLREMVRLARRRRRGWPHRQGRATSRALACLRALRTAIARHRRAQGARGRHQCTARRATQAGLPRARARSAGIPDRNRLRHGGGAPDLLGRGAQSAERAGPPPGGRHRRWQHRDHHRRALRAARRSRVCRSAACR